MDMPKAEVGVIIEVVEVISEPYRLHLGSIRIFGKKRGNFSESRMVYSNKEAQKRLVMPHQEITLVYICRVRIRLYVIKSLNEIYMSNNF